LKQASYLLKKTKIFFKLPEFKIVIEGVMFLKKFIFVLLFFINFLAAQESILVLTVPRSGTRLIRRTLNLLKVKYTFKHLEFAAKKPEVLNNYSKIIINVRDPRDVIITNLYMGDKKFNSYEKRGIFYKDPTTAIRMYNSNPDRQYKHPVFDRRSYNKWRNLTTEQKLSAMIEDSEASIWLNANGRTKNNYAIAMRLVSLPNTLLIKFEDLVGEKGKSCPERQKETISVLTNFINLPCNENKIKAIAKKAYCPGFTENGSDVPFVPGQAYKWKKIFNEENKLSFKNHEQWNNILLFFGYEKDNNW
jgi:hypothetical protein